MRGTSTSHPVVQFLKASGAVKSTKRGTTQRPRQTGGIRPGNAAHGGAPRRIPVVDGVRDGLPVAVPSPVTLGDAVARGLPDAVGLGLLEAVGVGLRVVTGLAVPLGVRDAEHVRVPQRVPEATNSHQSGRGGGAFSTETPVPFSSIAQRMDQPCRDALEGEVTPTRAPSIRPGTVSLTASARLNGICNRP